MLAEYALSGIDKPIGVSSYELTPALPPRLGRRCRLWKRSKLSWRSLDRKPASNQSRDKPRRREVRQKAANTRPEKATERLRHASPSALARSSGAV